MRSLVTSLVLLSFIPASASAQEMIEVPGPSDKPSPSTASPPTASPPTASPPMSPPADPKEAFDHRFLAFEDWVAYNVHSGAIVNAWSKPVEGKYRRPLSYGEFYERVGRGDLADRYRSRRNLKIGFAVGGGLAFVAGMGAVIGQLLSNGSAFDSCVSGNLNRGVAGSCDGNSSNGGYVAGGILIGAGAAAMIAAFATPLQPAQPYEAREMADQYNAKLRKELGLDAAPATTTAAPAGTTFTLAPSVDAKGGGLRLVARF